MKSRACWKWSFVSVTALTLIALTDQVGAVEPGTPLVLKDGRIASVTVHTLDFEDTTETLTKEGEAELDRIAASFANDCFLTAQAIGHVEPGISGTEEVLEAHRLARARADQVQNALIDAGLPPESIASVWDWQFIVPAPQVTLWVFALNPEVDCDGNRVGERAPEQVVAAPEALDDPAELEEPTATAGTEEVEEPTEIAAVETGAAGAGEPDVDPDVDNGENLDASESTVEAEVTAGVGAAAAGAAAVASQLPDDVVEQAPEELVEAPEALAGASELSGESSEPMVDAAEATTDIDENAIEPAAAPADQDLETASEVAPPAAATESASDLAAATSETVEPDLNERSVDEAAANEEEPAPVETAATDDSSLTGEADAGSPSIAGEVLARTTVVFDVNSSYFDASTGRELNSMMGELPNEGTYRISLQSAVGVGDVKGAETRDEAIRYNRWIAEQRNVRVKDWLEANAGDRTLQFDEQLMEDNPSRSVIVDITPAN